MSEDTKKCPFCAETIKKDALVCRYCGRNLKPIKTTARTADKKNKSKRIWIIGVLALTLVCCCSIIGVYIFSDSTGIMTSVENTLTAQVDKDTQPILVTPTVTAQQPDQNEPTNTDTSAVDTDQPVAESTHTYPPLAPSIEEIISKNESMTDAQRNAYNESLVGSLVVDWKGTVNDVDEGEIFGGFSVYVDMVSSNLGSEVHIKVSEEVALSLNLGQEIIFSGTIRSVSDFLGTTVFIEDATITPIE